MMVNYLIIRLDIWPLLAYILMGVIRRMLRLFFENYLTGKEGDMVMGEHGVIEQELPLVMRVEDVARHLRIARLTAYQLIHSQGFPTVRIGRCIRVPRDAFLRWLESQVSHDRA
jgi:excisionase family DNA binding protein